MALKNICILGSCLFLSVSLAACSSSGQLAPVVNVGQQVNAAQNTYVVRAGDTLYSIAWSAGLDYEDLAKANHIVPPYALTPGQTLVMTVKPSAEPAQVSAAPAQSVSSEIPQPTGASQTVYWSRKEKAYVPVAPSPLPAKSVARARLQPKAKQEPAWFHSKATWIWPVKGRVIQGFSMAPGANRGLNIASAWGAPIHAAAAGQVVYSGSGVRGYGNMIILKNAKHFLSAYAFNQKNLVQNGAWVKQGQAIATMGRNNAGQIMLHFEIRVYGRAVDPMRYLPKR